MSRKSKPIRRRLAAFLAVCMVASNLQGLGLAYGSEEIKPENANLIQLDTEKIREAAEQAVESGVLVSPPVMVATASTASNAIPFQNPAYELADASTLLAEGTVLPDKTSIRIFLEPKLETEEAEEVSEEDDSIELINDIGLEEELEDGYSLSGREQLIFLIKNEGKEAQGYQFQFGNKVTGVVVVESSNQLMEEYEMGDSEMSAGPGNETELAAPETEVQPEVPETEAQPEVSESEAAPEIPESEIQPEFSESEVTPETPETEAQPEVPETEAQPETEESQELEIQIETEAEQESGSETETEEDIVVEVLPEADQNIEEGQADPENLVAGILEKTAEFLTGTMTVYAAETATPSEVVVATGSNVIDTTKKEKKVFSAAADTADLAKLEIQPVNVLVEGGMEAIQIGKPKMGFFSRMFKNEEEISSVGMFALSLGDVVGNNQLTTASRDGDENGLTLYNYAPAQDGDINKAYNVINKYIANQGENSSLLRFFPGGFWSDRQNSIGWDESDAYEKPYNSWETKKGRTYNVVQNMPATDGSNNEVVNFDVLFPNEDQKGWKTDELAVKVYNDVNEGEFLTKDDPLLTYNSNTGYYEYDSVKNGVEFSNGVLASTENKNAGFWPFGQGKCFFGMEVGFDFYKPLTGRYNGQNMEFSFSGDDDVWVYLSKVDENGEIQNKKLALDLGGIHGRVDGTINFATGVITYSGPGLSDKENNFPLIYEEEKIYGNQGNQVAYAYLYTDEIAKEKGQDNKEYINYVGLDNASGMYHLSFFYLERGGNLSNCRLKFNLPVIPTEEILVTKEVKTDGTTDLDNMKYGFWLVSSEDSNQLKAYMEHGEQGPDVAISKQYIGVGMDGGVRLDVLPAGHYFYIEEENPGHHVNWEIIQNEGTVKFIEKSATERRSDIYQVVANEHRGFHIRCENVYEGLAPEIHKRAWKNDNKKSTYDIVLDVTGDTKDGADLVKPVVTDEIAIENLVFTDKVNATTDAPNLYLMSSKVEGAGNHRNKLKAQNNETEIIYSYDGDEIAWYNLATHTLTWNVAESLREGQTKSLIYEVKATEPFEENPEDYPHFGSVDTGTYAEQRGYWSNVKATMTYGKNGDKTLSYLQPVIRPDEPQIETFTLKKVVDGDEIAETKDFTFHLDINDEDENPYEGYIQINGTEENVESGRYSLTLSHDKAVTVGLPEGSTYTITEEEFNDGSYATIKTTVKKDNDTVVETNEIEGTIESGIEHNYLFTNIVKAYQTLTIEKEVAGAEGGTYEFTLSLPEEFTEKEVEKVLAALKADNENMLSQDGKFSITAAKQETGCAVGSVELTIHPDYSYVDFTITETDAQGAWKTEVKKNSGSFADKSVIEGVKAGDTITFKNSYFNHTITLQKEVAGYNPDSEAEYNFEVKLTGLSSSDKVKIKVGENQAIFKDGFADTILVSLKNNESVVISGLTKSVTSAVITEILPENTEYDVKLNQIKCGTETVDIKENGITVEFDKNENVSNSVIFVNKYEKRMGALQIVKQLEEEDNVSNAFRFKIEQMKNDNVVMIFYQTIIIPENGTEAWTEEITVPVGTYRITELDTIKYEADAKVQEVIVTDTSADDASVAVASVIFKNHKTTNQYFTDASIAVNKVTTDENGGFHYENIVDQPVAKLPENEKTNSEQLAQAELDKSKGLPSDKENEDDNNIV